MDRAVAALVALGVPGLVLCFLAGTSGLAGGAALVAALVAFGPGGILGGVLSAVALGLVSNAIAEFGLEAVAKAVVEGLLDEGMSVDEIRRKVKAIPWPLISAKLKREILRFLDRFD